MEQKFFICKHCGNMIGIIRESGVNIICCGQKMSELTANTSDGAAEKHVPVIKAAGDMVKVSIGSAKHPMLEEHHIEWVYLKTTHGGQRRVFEIEDKPEADFALAAGEKAEIAYGYCNLHGLWKAEI